jgi:prepilin signal peptidase PulO-like enzyme (type II secretory pathway)
MVDWMTPIIFVTGAIGAMVLAASMVPLRRRFGIMALCGVAGMLVALFALSFVTAIYADYGISALPLVFIAAAGVVQWVGDAISPRTLTTRNAVMTVITVILLVGMLPSVGSYLSDGSRFDYRPALARISREAPRRATLAWPIILQRRYAPQLRSYELLPSRPRLDSLLRRERDLWAVVSVKQYGIVGDDAGDLGTWLNAHCHMADHYQRQRFDYRLYRVELWRCTADTRDML